MPREYGAEPSYGPWAVAWGPWHMAFGPLPSTFGCLHRALGLRNRVTRSELACGREVSGVPGRAVGRQVLTHSRQRGPQSRHRALRSRQSAPRCRPQGAQHRKITKHVRDHRRTMTNETHNTLNNIIPPPTSSIPHSTTNANPNTQQP
jgi:hypothetical protein